MPRSWKYGRLRRQAFPRVALLIGGALALGLAISGLLVGAQAGQGTVADLGRIAAVVPALVYAAWWADLRFLRARSELEAEAAALPPSVAAVVTPVFDAQHTETFDLAALRPHLVSVADGPDGFEGRLRRPPGDAPQEFRPAFRAS